MNWPRPLSATWRVAARGAPKRSRTDRGVPGTGYRPDALRHVMNTNIHRDRRDRPENGDGPVVPTTRARQGVTGHNVRYVLLAGTLAVVVLFGIVYIAYFS